MPQENLLTDLTMTAEIGLYYDLYIPENISKPAPLLIAIHGYGMNKRYMMREARQIASDKFIIASLQGPHQHFQRRDDGYKIGFAWLTDHKSDEYIRLHHKFIFDVIEKLDDEQLIDRSRVFLYGFSQSSALNFRFAFTYPDVLKGIVAVCGAVPSDIETNATYKPFNAETLYLYSTDDEFYPLEKFTEFDTKLRERLPNYRSKLYEAKHEITDEMRDDIRGFLGGLR
jgi:phospholipase/carboxylesterase